MKVKAIFHVYASEKKNESQQIDGRLLCDVHIDDKLLLIKDANIIYYNKMKDSEGCLFFENQKEHFIVNIKTIFSYGKYWNYLDMGMSARLTCVCKSKINSSDLLYIVVDDN